MPLMTGIGLALLLFLVGLASSVCESLGFDDGVAPVDPGVVGGPAVEGSVYFGDGEVDLPEGAVVEVQLQDTSIADAPAVTLGEHVIRDARALPVAFRIPYDPSAINRKSREYSLQASVTLDGRLLYVNDTMHIVLTAGSPEDSDIEVIRIP